MDSLKGIGLLSLTLILWGQSHLRELDQKVKPCCCELISVADLIMKCFRKSLSQHIHCFALFIVSISIPFANPIFQACEMHLLIANPRSFASLLYLLYTFEAQAYLYELSKLSFLDSTHVQDSL